MLGYIDTKHSMKKNFSSFLSHNKILSILIVLGIFFRARHYFAGRSLWLDEAMLALDVLDLSFKELTQQPLPYQQGAPIGFLFSVKVTTILFGDSEYVFRLYSFGVSLLALFLMAFLARRYLGKMGMLFTLALFVSNPHLIYYSAETKQYMGDVAVSLLIFFLFSRQLDQKISSRRFAFFIFLNSLLIWFSHPAVFSIAAVGIILVIYYAQEKNKKAFFFALLNLILSGISAVLLYFFHLCPLSASKFLNNFWQDSFVPIPPNMQWFLHNWESLLENPLGLEAFPLLVFILLIGGMFFSWRHTRIFTSSLLLTLFFVFCAGVLQKYPLAERMLLFATPIFIFFLGAGIEALYSLIKEKRLAFFLTLFVAIYILYAPVGESFLRFKSPLYREHIRPSMAYIKEHFREGDLLYVYYYAEPAFLFYQPKYHLENIAYTSGSAHTENPDEYLREVDKLRSGRVWFLFTHVREVASINEEDFIINYLNQNAEKEREYRVPGTSVSLYLYELP